MTPGEAKAVIEKLIQEHGPDCTATGHMLILRGGEPAIVDDAMSQDPVTDIYVGDITKRGMKNGFSAKDWNLMAKLLVRAVNEAQKRDSGD